MDVVGEGAELTYPRCLLLQVRNTRDELIFAK